MSLPHDAIAVRPRPLFLVGMMGAGKTTIGRLLASRLACAFVDLDARIERLWGQPIPELFASGEASFRSKERAALESLTREPGFTRRRVVVATGGGILTTPGNRERMRCGVVVHLAVPGPLLAERLASPVELAARPMLADLEGAAEGPTGDPAAGSLGATSRVAPDIAHTRRLLRDRIQRLLDTRKAGYETADLEVDASASVEAVVTSILDFVSTPATSHAPAPSP